MILVVDPPPPPDARPEPELTVVEGRLGGPSYAYRGAAIDCRPGGDVCTLLMSDYPFHGWGLGSVDTIKLLIDLWLEERRLPKYMRVFPPAKP
jgi:hypothetical protein